MDADDYGHYNICYSLQGLDAVSRVTYSDTRSGVLFSPPWAWMLGDLPRFSDRRPGLNAR